MCLIANSNGNSPSAKINIDDFTVDCTAVKCKTGKQKNNDRYEQNLTREKGNTVKHCKSSSKMISLIFFENFTSKTK